MGPRPAKRGMTEAERLQLKVTEAAVKRKEGLVARAVNNMEEYVSMEKRERFGRLKSAKESRVEEEQFEEEPVLRRPGMSLMARNIARAATLKGDALRRQRDPKDTAGGIHGVNDVRRDQGQALRAPSTFKRSKSAGEEVADSPRQRAWDLLARSPEPRVSKVLLQGLPPPDDDVTDEEDGPDHSGLSWIKRLPATELSEELKPFKPKQTLPRLMDSLNRQSHASDPDPPSGKRDMLSDWLGAIPLNATRRGSASPAQSLALRDAASLASEGLRRRSSNGSRAGRQEASAGSRGETSRADSAESRVVSGGVAPPRILQDPPQDIAPASRGGAFARALSSPERVVSFARASSAEAPAAEPMADTKSLRRTHTDALLERGPVPRQRVGLVRPSKLFPAPNGPVPAPAATQRCYPPSTQVGAKSEVARAGRGPPVFDFEASIRL